jgi:hypothetical protein
VLAGLFSQLGLQGEMALGSQMGMNASCNMELVSTEVKRISVVKTADCSGSDNCRFNHFCCTQRIEALCQSEYPLNSENSIAIVLSLEIMKNIFISSPTPPPKCMNV